MKILYLVCWLTLLAFLIALNYVAAGAFVLGSIIAPIVRMARFAKAEGR